MEIAYPIDSLTSRVIMMSITRLIAVLATALASGYTAWANAALMDYSQDFEALNTWTTDSSTGNTSLSNDGWLVYANVYDSSGSFLYPYGPFPAPNPASPGPAFSLVIDGQGGAPQGTNQLVVFSDYNNFGAHSNGDLIESNVFQEQMIASADIGKTLVFSFDAKKGDIARASTATAFIKTVAFDTSLSNWITLDTTALPDLWDTYELSLMIDPSLVGQKVQFGFANVASFFEPSGVFYDNINTIAEFPSAVPLPSTLVLFALGLAGFGFSRRRDI
jgi:hypothetical protein